MINTYLFLNISDTAKLHKVIILYSKRLLFKNLMYALKKYFLYYKTI